MSVFESTLEEKDLDIYISDVDQSLASENSRFTNGDGVYVGSLMLRDFYKGKQWRYRKEGGGAMRTFNYCFTVVENMTAFLANETPELVSVPRDVSDPIEQARAEGISEVLGEIHRTNALPIQYQKGVRIGSLTGVTFIFGPVWDENSNIVRYWNIENPENIRPIWRDSNFTEMIGFLNVYRINLKSFKKDFKKQLADRGIDMSTFKPLQRTSSLNRPAEGAISEPMYKKSESGGMSDVPMVEVQEYYDDTFYMARVVGDGQSKFVVDFVKHDYGFVPGHMIPNIHLPGEARGTSDIENILDAQVAYNESKSNEEDIVRQVAFTSLWGKNLDNYSVIETGVGALYNFNDEAELYAMPRSANPLVLDNFERSVQGDLINLSGQNQALYPGGARGVLASTGRALSVMMQGINNKVSLRKAFWQNALEILNKNILMLVEKKVKGGKDLVDGNYRTDVFIGSVLLRDVTEEINKFNAKLQSMTTTQKNLGISSPSEEQKLMKEELKDPIFGVEIARQPGLLHQILQEAIQTEMAANAEAGGGEAGGMTMLNGNEGGAGGETMPMSSPQQRTSTSSPQGELRANAQRKTGATVAVSRATR